VNLLNFIQDKILKIKTEERKERWLGSSRKETSSFSCFNLQKVSRILWKGHDMVTLQDYMTKFEKLNIPLQSLDLSFFTLFSNTW